MIFLSFLSLVAADINTVSAQTIINATDSGWYDNSGFHSSINSNYAVGEGDGIIVHNFFVFDLTGISMNIGSATLTIENPSNGYYSGDAFEIWTLYDVSTDITSLTASGNGHTGIYDDLGSGTIYGSVVETSDVNGQLVNVTLNAAGIAALNAAKGGLFAIGGAITTLDGSDNKEYLFGHSDETYTRRLTLNAEPAVVPAMNEWGMIIFMVLAGIISVYYLYAGEKISGLNLLSAKKH